MEYLKIQILQLRYWLVRNQYETIKIKLQLEIIKLMVIIYKLNGIRLHL